MCQPIFYPYQIKMGIPRIILGKYADFIGSLVGTFDIGEPIHA